MYHMENVKGLQDYLICIKNSFQFMSYRLSTFSG